MGGDREMRKEVLGKKVEAMDMDGDGNCSKSNKTIDLLRNFLAVQQRRAEAYAKLRRGFAEYMVNGVDLDYQQLCSEITVEFNDCSKQVLEIESLLLNPDFARADLAELLKDVQAQEKDKLHLQIIEELMERLPIFKEIIDYYSGPNRVTAKQQQEELERVANTIPENVPASVKRFTDRVVLSLQSNPGWGWDKKYQFMDKLVWEVTQQYK